MFNTDQHKTELANGKLDKVISSLVTEFNLYLAASPSDFMESKYNELILISARSKDANNKNRSGIIGNEAYMVEKNRLISSTLALLNEIKDSIVKY
jgi:hypothetical protein